MLWAGLITLLLGLAAAKDTYVVITPKDVRPGVPLNISVNILHATGDVHVTAKLIHVTDKSVKASSSATFQQHVPDTMRIMVPDTIPSGTYQLTVEGSNGLTFTDKTNLHYASKGMSIFIQTDKAMYKPGQTVNFRTFAIYPNLTVYSGPMDIEIYDPNSNKIKQWFGLKDASGVLTNFMAMDTKPVLGDWKIRVKTHGLTKDKMFTVAHYVLPKFEVTVDLPSYDLTSATDIKGTVKAKYTYGKPVNGTVKIRAHVDFYQSQYYHPEPIPTIELTMDINGEAKFTLPVSGLTSHTYYTSLNGHNVVVEANVTESLTQITLDGTSKMHFYTHAEKIELLPSNPTTFKPGLQYIAYAKVVQQDDMPLAAGSSKSLIVHTSVTANLPETTTPMYYYGPRTMNYQLPDQSFTLTDTGLVQAKIDIPHNATSISLNFKYGQITQYKSVQRSYSPSDSFMQIFLESNNLQAGHDKVVDFRVVSTSPIDKLIYQVLGRGSIAVSGSINGNNAKAFQFHVPLNAKMAPNARIVAYYVRADGEIVTDSISFDVSGTFENEVSIRFDKTKAQPGEGINVDVTADPNSIVNLLAVDQSVLLLKSGNDITPAEVVDELKSYDTIVHSNNGGPIFLGGGGFGGGGIMPEPMPVGRKKRMIWWPFTTYYGGSDAEQIFQNAGVNVMTDALVYHHVEPHIYLPSFHQHHGFLGGFGGLESIHALAGVSSAVSSIGMVPGAGSVAIPSNPQPQPPHVDNHASQDLKEPARVRLVFPETWLWTNQTIGPDGHVTIAATIPDTITSWVASAFAVHATSGLGIAPTSAKVEAFRPFFVSLTLPYSVVRGEQLVLQANVFNYMTMDMDVVVTLEKNDDLVNVVFNTHGTESYIAQTTTKTVHVTAGGTKSVFFPVVPAGLGSVSINVKAQSTLAADAVRRQLLIEAEGVPKEYNIPMLVDLKHNTNFAETVDVTLPAGVVAGSHRVHVSAIGDLMGPTVNGLDKLLRMPTGCGEQTMLGFAPDVFVTNYLTDTHQLTSSVEEKAINFMEKGYQRELTFQHWDGSFSAFGDRDPSGSMWLTAFVAKSFHQAKRHVFIDDETLTRAIDWMINRQAANGSFPEPGRIIHKNMQGGSASGASLTAFVLIALLENSDLQGGVHLRIQSAANKAQTYLEGEVSAMTDPYGLSICSYALTLARSHSSATTFHKLMATAVTKDGMTHWHEPESASSSTGHYWSPPHQQSKPVDIEMTSYGLMVFAHNGQFTEGLPFMKWITKQRNPNGGFSSTQDTVLALQSLSEFARIGYSEHFNMQIGITAGQTTHKFNVTRQNALVLQSLELPSIPSHVTVTGTGSGMGLVEVSVFFNVEQEVEQPSFEVDVTIIEETINSLKVRSCTKWLKTGASGMAVQEVGVPTGFAPDVESIGKMATLKKTETENRKVILYFDEITTTPLCVTMDAFRTDKVAKSQPAPIRVYDYYEPSNQVTKFYQSIVLKNSGVCDVCNECGCHGQH
ncbi:CD109 antigen-like isoform X3 [Mizuhopecten yessoensis]|uniref:CD109 antigen-like isoform X3 n=1 Tax=Mizuhopecten yessoensis TaxID=6573 RepID=UPI000B45D3E5|nr:CD109 antigen-like isoform X3 [Mizuhopecten yessoensis]